MIKSKDGIKYIIRIYLFREVSIEKFAFIISSNFKSKN